MKVGRMREEIVLKNRSVVKNATGERVPTYSTLATVWAEFQPVSGNEAIALNRDTAAQIGKFFIHHRSDITEQTRIEWSGKAWNIKYIKAVSRDKYNDGLEIVAEAVTL